MTRGYIDCLLVARPLAPRCPTWLDTEVVEDYYGDTSTVYDPMESVLLIRAEHKLLPHNASVRWILITSYD